MVQVCGLVLPSLRVSFSLTCNSFSSVSTLTTQYNPACLNMSLPLSSYSFGVNIVLLLIAVVHCVMKRNWSLGCSVFVVLNMQALGALVTTLPENTNKQLLYGVDVMLNS